MLFELVSNSIKFIVLVVFTKTKIMRFYLVFVVSFFLQMGLYGQCDGGDPSTNFSNWDNSVSIEANFNRARREDEDDHASMAANCLGDMTEIPGGWNNATFDEIALYIHNSEREARGIKPLYGVETHLDAVSQAHSDWQINNEVFAHAGDPSLGTSYTYHLCGGGGCGVDHSGSSPFERMNQNAPLKDQWQTEGENIALSLTSGATISSLNGLVTGLYRFMYQDAGSSWGHRHNMLKAFNDDWGDAGNEGFIGVGVAQGGTYTKCSSCNTWNKAAITTIDYYDPTSSATGYTFSAVLPVDLIAFDAQKSGHQVLLSWATAEQENSEYFAIQRSKDGRDFRDIGYVDVTGDTKLRTDYTFVDAQPFNGVNYYRLRTVDFDAKESQSKIVSVGLFGAGAIAVYPNPVQDKLSIDLMDGTKGLSFVLYDLAGQVILSEKIVNQAISMETVQSGAYIYLVKDIYGAVVKEGKLLKL